MLCQAHFPLHQDGETRQRATAQAGFGGGRGEGACGAKFGRRKGEGGCRASVGKKTRERSVAGAGFGGGKGEGACRGRLSSQGRSRVEWGVKASPHPSRVWYSHTRMHCANAHSHTPCPHLQCQHASLRTALLILSLPAWAHPHPHPHPKAHTSWLVVFLVMLHRHPSWPWLCPLDWLLILIVRSCSLPVL